MPKRKKIKNLEVLLEVTEAASASLNLDDVSDFILKKAKEVLGVDHSALFLLDDVEKHLILFSARGFSQNEINNIKILGGWEEVNKELVRKSKPLLVNNIEAHPAFKKRKLAFFHEKLPFSSFIGVPLRTKKKKVIAALIVSNKKRRKTRFTKEDKELLSALANHVSIALVNAKLHKDVQNTFLSTIKALITAVDAKDPYTHGHSERVMRYSLSIAEHMDLDRDFIENLKFSSLLHDIGKIGIGENILSKKGPLDEKELKIIRKHPFIGARIVGSIMNSKDILPGVKEHHEHFDGTGYPLGLKGRHISLEGRIIAIADTFDTLTTTRPYQRAVTNKEAFFEILHSSGTHFDPATVKAFEKSFSKEPYIWSAKSPN
ncbi:MAG: HD domain-containing protein [Candidatus Omnitrophica bacterium]|nr:HD domain-containing protein [Candidatus Omnitrophota bacterium]